MGDSVKLIESGYVQRIHGIDKFSKKLHKGHGITAATASIPSKYQTIVNNDSEKSGFSSKVKRFTADAATMHDNPGPGTYLGLGHTEKRSPSYSKAGTGGFASKCRRIQKQMDTKSPAIGTYKLQSFLISRNDFNKSTTTSCFHHPIAQEIQNKFQTPGPNEYDITKVVKATGKTNNVSANAAFKSTSARKAFNLSTLANPAPGQYEINEKLVKSNVQAPCSIFKSKTSRVQEINQGSAPGPAAYRPFSPIDPVPKTVFPRKHYLCISAPALPLPQVAPEPGPGAYEIVDYNGPEKHYMSDHMFVSSTSRWAASQPKTGNIPGPAHYRPKGLTKQSFFYNIAGRWI